MKNTRVRAIIPFEKGILLIHRIRIKDGETKNYFVFPGGGLEPGETIDNCIIREVFEELGIDIQPVKRLYELEENDSQELFYLCHYIKGAVGSGSGPEFSHADYQDRGQYIPEVLTIEDIKSASLLSKVRDALLIDLVRYQKFEDIPLRQL